MISAQEKNQKKKEENGERKKNQNNGTPWFRNQVETIFTFHLHCTNTLKVGVIGLPGADLAHYSL